MRLDRLGQGLGPPERGRRWVVVSAAVHVVVIAIVLTLRPPPRPVVRYIQLDDGGGRDLAAPIYRSPARSTPVPGPRRPPPVPFERPSAPVIAAVPTAAPLGLAVQAPPADSIPVDTHAALEARYGDGRLWVRVSDVVAGRLPAKREAEALPSHIALVDSALAEKIRTYMDTVPPDSFATRQAPNWTTEIAGQPWGLDGKWIYLGPIKIPATVLALLPLPSGNYDLAQRNIQLQLMREDLMDAARRAESAAEFKKFVKELRERKEKEHQQRIPPTPPAPRDTLIP